MKPNEPRMFQWGLSEPVVNEPFQGAQCLHSLGTPKQPIPLRLAKPPGHVFEYGQLIS